MKVQVNDKELLEDDLRVLVVLVDAGEDGMASAELRERMGYEHTAQSSYRLDKLGEEDLVESWYKGDDGVSGIQPRYARATSRGELVVDEYDVREKLAELDESEYSEIEEDVEELKEQLNDANNHIEMLNYQFDSMAKLVGAFQDLLEDDGYDVESYLKARQGNRNN